MSAGPLGLPRATEHASEGASGFLDRAGRVSWFDRWLLRRMVAAARAPVAVVLWDGEEVSTQEPPVARVRIADRRALFRLAVEPNLHFGDLYSVGRAEVDGDLVSAAEAVFHAQNAASRPGMLRRQLSLLRHRWRSRSAARSKWNIHHHYDLGNDFYGLWLDTEARQYTCAYYPVPGMSLEQAQLAKMHHVCRKLRLQPGDHVVEAGCGWGGLALFMARQYGVRVRAYNISREQVAHARQQARACGLAGSVEFIEDDYRTIRGDYDVFVSVGMLEHIGLGNYRELGRVIDRCLKQHGRGLIHTIGRCRPGPLHPWIERRIFPGAHPPTLRQMSEIFEPWDLSVLDVENLRLHYARTLRHWLERFTEAEEQIRRMFDERFLRAWRLYLAGSIAAFTTGGLHLFQVAFARSRDNDLPWSRAHLYAQDDPA